MKLAAIPNYSLSHRKSAANLPFRGNSDSINELLAQKNFTDANKNLIFLALHKNDITEGQFSKIMSYRNGGLKPFEIAELVKVLNPDNNELVDMFFVSENPETQKRLDNIDAREIANLLAKISKDNKSIFTKLFNPDDNNFSLEKISRLLPIANKDNIQDIMLLSENHVNWSDMTTVLPYLKENNIDKTLEHYKNALSLNEFEQLEQPYTELQNRYVPMLNPSFTYLAHNITPDNLKYLEDNLSKYDIPLEKKLTWLPAIHDENLDLLDRLIKEEQKNGEPYPSDINIKILSLMPKPCLKTYLAFLSSEICYKEDIYSVLKDNKFDDNGEFLIKLSNGINVFHHGFDDIFKILAAQNLNNRHIMSEYSTKKNIETRSLKHLLNISDRNRLLFDYIFKDADRAEHYKKHFTSLSFIPPHIKAEGLMEVYKDIEKMVYSNPGRYINGDDTSLENVKKFFDKNYSNIILALYLSDRPTVELILEKRFENANEILKDIKKIQNKVEVKRLANLKSTNNKNFTPNDKLDIMQIISAYEHSEVPLPQHYADKLDISLFRKNLFTALMQRFNINIITTGKISNDRLLDWDLKYFHLINKEFRDIVIDATMNDYKSYIENDEANWLTKKQFFEIGLNYAKWLNPSKENIETVDLDANKSSYNLQILTNNILEDISTLRSNSFIKKHIDKVYSNCIQRDNSFALPEKVKNSPANMLKFLTDLQNNLAKFFQRAQDNLNEGKYVDKAQTVLTIQSHLKNNIALLNKIKDDDTAKLASFKIKIWDRYPQKDLFQGNYSNCCIGMGESNASAMVDYLSSTAFNMIEILDGNNEKILGNALIYFVKNEKNKPALMIDNVELSNKLISANVNMTLLKASLIHYANKVCKEICGNQPYNIYMGTKYNDIDTKSYNKISVQLQPLIVTNSDSVYLDAFGGWTTPKTRRTTVYKII